MIHYQLRCGTGHEFDGWFAGSAAFDDQAARRLIACPHCGTTSVDRALMAPSLVTRGTPSASSSVATQPDMHAAVPVETHTTPDAPEVIPDAIRAKLQRLRREIEQNCDYVGRDFAAEARRIHAGETQARPIYGETTPDQAESLAQDGIDVARIPWLPRADG